MDMGRRQQYYCQILGTNEEKVDAYKNRAAAMHLETCKRSCIPVCGGGECCCYHSRIMDNGIFIALLPNIAPISSWGEDNSEVIFDIPLWWPNKAACFRSFLYVQDMTYAKAAIGWGLCPSSQNLDRCLWIYRGSPGNEPIRANGPFCGIEIIPYHSIASIIYRVSEVWQDERDLTGIQWALLSILPPLLLLFAPVIFWLSRALSRTSLELRELLTGSTYMKNNTCDWNSLLSQWKTRRVILSNGHFNNYIY